MKNFINDWPSNEKCFKDGRVLFNEVQNFSRYFKEKIKQFDIKAHNYLQNNTHVDASSFGGQKEYLF